MLVRRLQERFETTAPNEGRPPAGGRLADPMFDDATVKARVATVLTERANAITSPQTIAAAQGDYARYGQDTEFLVVPTNQQLAAVTPAQLKATLARFLKWKHRTSYFGPRTPAAATTAVVLGDGTLAAAPKRPVKFRKPNTALVTDQKTAQTHIWLTWPRAPANDAERAAGTVFGAYIGIAGTTRARPPTRGRPATRAPSRSTAPRSSAGRRRRWAAP